MPGDLYRSYGKRLFDAAASLAGLALVGPLLLLIALIVKLSDGGPVLFRQVRVGRGFRPFLLLKFRTMVVDAGINGLQITTVSDPRITPVGRVLRRTKLDELPQLLNVLKGDMSIVGPRPEVPKYVEMFRDRHYNEILSLRPGITDYAAIEYRDEEAVLQRFTDPEEGYVHEVLPRKIKLYERYLREIGFLTDLKIIALTIGKILHP